MSRSSFASFHLTGIKPSSGKLMTSSVDRLFENEGDVFISSNYNDFNQGLPSIQETASVQSKSPEPSSTVASSSASLATKSMQRVDQAGRESPGTTPSTAKSSRRDSLTDRVVLPPSLHHQTGLPAHAPPPFAQMPPPAAVAPPMHLPIKSVAAASGGSSQTHGMENAGSNMVMKNRLV